MRGYFTLNTGRERLLRRALRSGCTRVLLTASAIVITTCGSDLQTAPSVLAAASAIDINLADTSLSPRKGTSQRARTGSLRQTTTAPTTPGRFRLDRRNGTQLWLNWDWVSGGTGAIHFELSYAGRTVVLNQYYPGHIQDISDLDLGPGHAYTFSLRAIDEAGNASSPAQLVFETTPPDAPSSLQQVSTRRVTYNDGRVEDFPDLISYTLSSDNAGPIRTHEAIVDGRSLGDIRSSMQPGVPDQFSLFRQVFESYTSQPCGPTIVQLRAYDSSLNASQLSAPLTVMFPEYENCPPPHRDTR